MAPSPPPDSALEHGRRGHIRKYLQRFTTTIRRGSKDAATDYNIPQSTTETHEHSHDDTLFDFSNIITADEPPTIDHGLEQSRPEQSQPTPSMTSETFHIDRASVYQERAQKLRDRYGLNVAGNDRSSFPSTARRVQKPARMRVHRTCHMCGVDFGHGIHCRACHHRLCGDCPRAPGRRIQEAMAQAREFPFHVVADESSSSLDSPMIEMPSETPSSLPSPAKHASKPSSSLGLLQPDENLLPAIEIDEDAIDFSPALLTRAARHGASTQFIPVLPRSSRHVPYSIRDPILKAPAGVQRVYRKPRQRVRYTCHECHTAFDKHVRVCSKCSHERCHECRDVPSRKTQPDPRLIEAVNQRLAQVGE